MFQRLKVHTLLANCVLMHAFLLMPTTTAHAADDPINPVFSPTAERLYYYIKFDRELKAKYPNADPITSATLNGEKCKRSTNYVLTRRAVRAVQLAFPRRRSKAIADQAIGLAVSAAQSTQA